MHPPNPHHDEHPHHIARNARNGLILFAVYVVFYAGFMYLSAFRPDIISIPIRGVNLSIWYGFALIAAAFALAMIYMALCRKGTKQGQNRP